MEASWMCEWLSLLEYVDTVDTWIYLGVPSINILQKVVS
jgi:hypothetical protein